MHSTISVVYDACVLYPAPLRDFLMRLALTDLFRAKWSNLIHDEWISNVLKKRPDLDAATLEKTRHLMNAHVCDSVVEGFEHFISAIDLPDANDRHVVAAAIHSDSRLIITFNIKDFPSDILEQYDLEAKHPDDFIFHQLSLSPAVVCQAAARHRRALKSPPKTVSEYLDTLLKQRLTRTVGELKKWQSFI